MFQKLDNIWLYYLHLPISLKLAKPLKFVKSQREEAQLEH